MASDHSALVGQYYLAASLPLVRMPAKGKYFLNEQKLKQEALYRKFSGISQYQPFVLLLGLSMLTCATLLVLFFSLKLVRCHIHANALTQYTRLHAAPGGQPSCRLQFQHCSNIPTPIRLKLGKTQQSQYSTCIALLSGSGLSLLFRWCLMIEAASLT